MTLPRVLVAGVSHVSRCQYRRGVGCVGFLSQVVREAALLLGYSSAPLQLCALGVLVDSAPSQ